MKEFSKAIGYICIMAITLYLANKDPAAAVIFAMFAGLPMFVIIAVN